MLSDSLLPNSSSYFYVLKKLYLVVAYAKDDTSNVFPNKENPLLLKKFFPKINDFIF